MMIKEKKNFYNSKKINKSNAIIYKINNLILLKNNRYYN